MMKFGFIGIGNMGGAVAAAAAKTVDPARILVAAKHAEKAAAFAEKYGMEASDNMTIARSAKFIILGVKPQFMAEVLTQIAPVLEQRKDVVLVSMAAGLTMRDICDMAGGEYPVIRIMPNTPVQVGQGVVMYTANERVSQAELEAFLSAISSAGILDRLDEKLMDAGTAVAGCGPAFAYLFLEALADGGVACGLPRGKALEYAAQTLCGSALLLMESGIHPGVLKDAVCSPGGSTIQGVRVLENGGLRGTVMEAVAAAYEKNKTFSRS